MQSALTSHLLFLFLHSLISARVQYIECYHFEKNVAATGACESISLVTSMTDAGVASLSISADSIHITLMACFTFVNICVWTICTA